MRDVVFADLCRSGYRAVLRMIARAVELCPDALWDVRGEEPPFWQQAYHALMYTDFYLRPAPGEFERPDFVEEKAGDLAFVPTTVAGREAILAYASRVLSRAEEATASMAASELEGTNPFGWTGPTVAHRHAYNIRHAQHHAGRLNSFLARRTGKAAAWVMYADWSAPPSG